MHTCIRLDVGRIRLVQEPIQIDGGCIQMVEKRIRIGGRRVCWSSGRIRWFCEPGEVLGKPGWGGIDGYLWFRWGR